MKRAAELLDLLHHATSADVVLRHRLDAAAFELEELGHQADARAVRTAHSIVKAIIAAT